MTSRSQYENYINKENGWDIIPSKIAS